MNKTFNYIVPPQQDQMALGPVLRQGLGLTARQVKQVKFQPDGLWLNDQRQKDGRLVTTRTPVSTGDHIRVCFREKSSTVIANSGELNILREDEDLVFLNKPAGLVAHPAHGHYADTLVNRLAARYEEPVRLIGRLDKDTSGVITAARSSVAANRMEVQRKKGQLSREYLALVSGTLSGEGEVDQPLLEDRQTLMKMKVDPAGKPAQTEYQVWRSWEDCSLVWLRLKTGRTHQIRVHMAWLGHPLLGDSLYGQEGSGGMSRTALHSWRVRALQPFTGEELMVQTLPPDDFKQQWEKQMMNEYRQYMERLMFPPAAVEALLAKTDAELEVIVRAYMQEELTLKEALEKTGGDYGRNMLFLLGCLPELRRRYQAAGLPDELFWHTMMDLKYKLMECWQVKGEWGTFVPWWYDGFFKMNRFALGRLQFEKVPYRGPVCHKAGLEIVPGDTVINMHIPSAGPLTEELCKDAYQQAYEFYPECRRDGKLVFVCHSWLLDPVYAQFLPTSSNILRFQRDFDILSVEKLEEFGDAWRVFGAESDLPPEQLPRKTSMQRAFADFLAAGGKTGEGLGLFVWNGGRV